MYLSDRDIIEAIESGRLILEPQTAIGPTSIDLHLDDVDQARIWDVEKLQALNREHGLPERELRIAKADYGRISERYLIPPPLQREANEADKVIRRDQQIIVRPHGFVLWQTKEIVGTPEENPELMCFIDGKSTRSRTGLVVHLTAPNIHAGWSGKVTLEMANLGPLDIVLQEGDAVAQVTVAEISRPPLGTMTDIGSVTHRQTGVTGRR